MNSARQRFIVLKVGPALLIAANLVFPGTVRSATEPGTNVLDFAARGIVQDIRAAENTLVVKHEAIPGYMEGMTMPFKVREAGVLSVLQAGDEISFRLHVTETESWIDRVRKIGTSKVTATAAEGRAKPKPIRARHPLLDYGFTNELGRVVRLADFHGQALAITFFFTRCPIPDFCPRLSKNFQEACRKLSSIPNGPTNWHFLSVSFDTQFDTPARLKAYGEQYGYDPKHWTFLTGPADKIAELAGQSGARFDKEGSLFSHNFRTLIVDATGKLQMSFPIGGNLTDAIVEEMLRAATAKPQEPR